MIRSKAENSIHRVIISCGYLWMDMFDDGKDGLYVFLVESLPSLAVHWVFTKEHLDAHRLAQRPQQRHFLYTVLLHGTIDTLTATSCDTIYLPTQTISSLGPNLQNFVKWTSVILSQFFCMSCVCQLISYRTKSLRKNCEMLRKKRKRTID